MNEQFGYSVPSGSFIDLSDEQSSLIDTITLMGDGTMDVVFKKRPDITYTYQDVPPAVWDRVLQGSPAKDGTMWSIGAAFHKYVVRKPQLYPFTKRSE